MCSYTLSRYAVCGGATVDVYIRYETCGGATVDA